MNSEWQRFTVLLLVGVLLASGRMSNVKAQDAGEEAVVLGEDHSASEGAEVAESSDADDEKPGSFWMEQKLRLSKEMLAGLASGDFDVIGKNAEFMRGLNRFEQFVRRNPNNYSDHLRLFNMANRALIEAAQEENLEAATLAFNQLTVSCVSCHKTMRGE